ncbi:MAG: glycosyltransferase family 2 protein [Planctomycetota bacterium]
MISVVIPAHNEEAVIGRCLSALLSGDGALTAADAEVIVACNGCTDRTAEVAADFGGPVRVVEASRASKVAALNAGDEAAQGAVRVYLDADVVVSGAAVREVVGVLGESGVEAAAPLLAVDTSRSSWAVRAFYRVWMALPYFAAGGMIGSGFYAVSEAGRARFDRFPDLIADDGFVRSLFSAQERRTVRSSTFQITAPATLSGVIQIKTRARFGNAELRLRRPGTAVGGENGAGDLLRLMLRRPWWIADIAVYAYAQWKTRRATRAKLAAGDFGTWERDDSSRRAVGGVVG